MISIELEQHEDLLHLNPLMQQPVQARMAEVKASAPLSTTVSIPLQPPANPEHLDVEMKQENIASESH